jgi:2-octaprenyl-6-methoxyphenol hydroxylase
MSKNPHDFDVLIVGGGPAGLSLAGLLGENGVRVACIDREDKRAQLDTAFDGRTTAISFGSRQVLEAAGVWPALDGHACAIETIRITDGDSPTLVEFNHTDTPAPAFGWIMENRLLRQALFARAAALDTVRHIAPAAVTALQRDEGGVTAILADGTHVRAPLLVGADGRGSFVRGWMGIGTRQWSYRQRAITCTVEHEHPHRNIAIENFRPEGPFAILPMTDGENGAYRSSVVWTEHGPDRQSFRHMDDDTFNAALTARFPDFYGAAKQIGVRGAYPLGLIHAHNYTAPRAALIGDAAHGIHPIAGQGLNLGFRDIAVLAELVIAAVNENSDPGSDTLLAAYQRRRRLDNMAMAGTTDALTRLFSNNISPVRLLRRVGLRLVDRTAPAKKFFMHQAMGLSPLTKGKGGILSGLAPHRAA